jgi:hypothetical protein
MAPNIWSHNSQCEDLTKLDIMQSVTLITNALEPESYERVVVKNISVFLQSRFTRFPKTAKIYHEQISQDNDVTPQNLKDIDKLNNLRGELYVIVHAGDPITIVAVGLAVASVAFALTIDIPTPTQRNTQASSPNNSLSERQNKERLHGRIPDIFGTVRSTPDLISPLYKVYEDHQEVEYSMMCIGRGEYEIDAQEVRDDTTKISDISGASVNIFKPYTSPNTQHSPQLTIGNPILEPVLAAKRSNAVNGQVLRAPNSNSLKGADDIKFNSLGQVKSAPGTAINFTEKFTAGDTIQISDAVFTGPESGSSDGEYTKKVRFWSSFVEYQVAGSIVSSGDIVKIERALFVYDDGTESKLLDLSGTYTVSSSDSSGFFLQNPSSVNSDWNLITGNFTGDKTPFTSVDISVSANPVTVNLNGSYTVVSVNSDTITLDSPASVKSDWNDIASYENNETGYLSPKLVTSANKLIGWFTLDEPGLTDIYFNFVALNGLYKDDGKKQLRFDVTISATIRAVDENDNPIGMEEAHSITLEGSSLTTSTRAVTLKVRPSFSGRCQVRAWRVTPSDLDFEGSVVDEVKWRDVYAMTRITEEHFGDVTTVHSKTYATDGALSIKNRKLNMLVTRKIPTRISGNTFTTELNASTNVADILCFICLDPKIGNRSILEVDVDNIYDTVEDIKNYFGTDSAAEFNYTFDSENLSFEETISSIAQAIFCKAYRRGSQIKLTFEKLTDTSTILFNHRNKIPGSESRTVRFGNQDGNDGIEFQYQSNEDDAIETIYIPSDKSAINPKKIESIGVRNYEQAFFHAWRAYNKVKYQNIAVDFEATAEANVLTIADRILVADNTRSGTQDGEIISQDGLILELSQPYQLDENKQYTIFLQHTDASVEPITISAGEDEYHVVLAHAPKQALSLNTNHYAVATYQIVANDSTREHAFLLTEKNNQSNFTSRLTAINYDTRYYEKDTLLFHLQFDSSNYIFSSRNRNSPSPKNTATITFDNIRGYVHYGSSANDYINVSNLFPTPSYTKLLWVKKNSSDNGNLISSAYSLDEVFWINNLTLAAGHSANYYHVTATLPSLDEWHHCAVTYDEPTQTMTLYINGNQVDQNSAVSQRNLNEIRLFALQNSNALRGYADDVRYLTRALDKSEIQDIFNNTKVN